jgi:hypothetical protein
MPLDILRSSDIHVRPQAQIEAPHTPMFCLILLVAAAVLASLVFACATPFAAFAVIAVSMLCPPAALSVVAATWVVNQAIGFGVLGYPTDPNTILWGVAIGVAALFATVVAALAWRLPSIGRPMSLCASLVAGYAAYEIVLFGFAAVLGDSGAFAVAIVARLGFLNTTWLIGLGVIAEGWRALHLHRERVAA